jgi:hydroxymethylbilane synthase
MRVGTRGSALALAQARGVVAALPGGESEHDLITITTSGDRGAAGGDKERWVKELEQALLDGRIDLAVHSAKDVPADLPPGLSIVAAPRRADPRDALCGAPSLGALPAGAVVGTSSVRRAALLHAARADLEVVDLRGNVDTRLEKLRAGDHAAIVLALAGLERLGLADAATGVLDAAAFTPAAGQGTLVLEARSHDGDARAVAGTIADDETMTCLAAERALVRGLDADCHTPVGAHAVLSAGGALTLRAFVGCHDGSAWVRDELGGNGGEPEALGAAVADRLRAAGADEVLGR